MVVYQYYCGRHGYQAWAPAPLFCRATLSPRAQPSSKPGSSVPDHLQETELLPYLRDALFENILSPCSTSSATHRKMGQVVLADLDCGLDHQVRNISPPPLLLSGRLPTTNNLLGEDICPTTCTSRQPATPVLPSLSSHQTCL